MDYVSVLIILLLTSILILVYKLKSEDNKSSSIDLLQKEIQSMKETFDNRLDKNIEKIYGESKHQAKQSQDVMLNMTKEMERIKEKSEQMLSFTDQLNNLEKVLSAQKQRGALGEHILDNVLSDIFPPNLYKTQYTFSDGTRVDAVLKIKDKIIPIDSKFPLENYRQYLDCEDKTQKDILYRKLRSDIKKRIDETSKYIRPEESTMDFAFMFVPSESLYYTLISESIENENIISYAISKKKIILVSPTTIVAYLQTVLQGLRGMEIEEKAKKILEDLAKINKKHKNLGENFSKLGKSLSTTVNHFNVTSKSLKTSNKEILKLTDSKEYLGDISEIERPQIKE